MKTRARRIAVNAMLLALLIIFTLLMNIPIFIIATAVLPLIVLTVACQVEGWFTSIVMAFAFGVLSFIGSFISPSPLAPVFQNPLVSLVPRLLIGVLGLCVYKLILFITVKLENKDYKVNKRVAMIVASGLGGAFSVMFNTLFVLSSMWILFGGDTVAGTSITIEFITGLVSINFVIELLGTAFITPPIVWSLNRYLERTRKMPLTTEEIEVLDSCDSVEMHSLTGVSDSDNLDCCKMTIVKEDIVQE